MARYSNVDKNSVLDVAEQLVRTKGVAALTMAAVAKAAGISKGGVQSSFGTKDDLINAMYDRWAKEYDHLIKQQVGGDPGPTALLHAHIDATLRTDSTEADRAAGMMASMLNAPEHLEKSQQWYATRSDAIDVTTKEGRRARLALLASDGLFMLTSFGFMKMSAQQWRDVCSDIQSLLDNNLSDP